VNNWEIIADRLSKAGWRCGCISSFEFRFFDCRFGALRFFYSRLPFIPAVQRRRCAEPEATESALFFFVGNFFEKMDKR
jgi:hypothetical protein